MGSEGRGALLNAVDLAITNLNDMFKRIESITTLEETT
jgi:hypothetical protein